MPACMAQYVRMCVARTARQCADDWSQPEAAQFGFLVEQPRWTDPQSIFPPELTSYEVREMGRRAVAESAEARARARDLNI
jgi:hypothetical protein